MNDIERMLTKGFSPKRLAAAAHELGHGYGWLAAGFRPKMLSLQIGWFGGVTGGDTRLGRVEVEPRQRRAYLVGLLGGHAAQARFLHCHQGMSLPAARRAAEPNAGWDYGRFFDLVAEWDIRPSVNAIYQDAERMVSRAGGRIDKATPRLARSGRLSGGAL